MTINRTGAEYTNEWALKTDILPKDTCSACTKAESVLANFFL